MKKLNSNNRIFDEGQVVPNGLHQHNSGAFTQREITGVGQHAQGVKSPQTHGSANQIQLASGQKLHILNQHLVSTSQQPSGAVSASNNNYVVHQQASAGHGHQRMKSSGLNKSGISPAHVRKQRNRKSINPFPHNKLLQWWWGTRRTTRGTPK